MPRRAAIISAEDLERLQRLEAARQQDFAILRASQAAFADVPAAELERELAQTRSEITSLRTKIERDARNRRRAEEIARKLLDDK